MFKNSYQFLPAHFYSVTQPEPLIDARLVHCNHALIKSLGLPIDEHTLFALTKGEDAVTGFTPLAQKYTGHQFGYYNPNLGDGRGVLLGQVIDKESLEWDIHLKGSGRTAYSRQGDGRAVLRSAIREYIIGEALHGLGIPTSRCLSLVHSPEPVRREQYEDRASYLRIAKTHIRFGHFEWLAQLGNPTDFKQLANYAIEQVYPELTVLDETTRYAELLKQICGRTALLMASWQVSGFCHGVMNTDNMSIAGETFDFGPYAFLDDCKIHYVCNHSDTEGRYAYSQQPNIGLWNCQVLGQAFSLLLDSEQIEQAITHYIETYNHRYLQKMGAKFGFAAPHQADKQLIADTLILMDQSDLDFHYFFQL
ncbi:MAG: YdiU family protein, partial [Gammaproteobacteria bacterium]|nr:YdiU family protein [Gammaproteobacteria bacterium]